MYVYMYLHDEEVRCMYICIYLHDEEVRVVHVELH